MFTCYETCLQHWTAMRRIDELIIIIPVILNLKGNLEMNLSARLGTAVRVYTYILLFERLKRDKEVKYWRTR